MSGTISARQAAIDFLTGKRNPQKAKAIIEAVLANPEVKLGGKTPEATISAMLSVENKKGGIFERTAPGTYKLRKGATVKKGEEPVEETDADLKKAALAADEQSRKAAAKNETKKEQRKASRKQAEEAVPAA